jgi:molybdate transport system substrate-binding protein
VRQVSREFYQMKKYFFLFLLVFGWAGCRTDTSVSENKPTANTVSITVSAAVSLKDALNEIGALYKTKTGRIVNFNFGASGALQKQIETGAPADVFVSAGEQQMNELANKNLIDAATRKDFVLNSLVMIVPAAAKIQISSFSDLTKTEVQKIAVGNPKTVPAGQYTGQILEKLNLKNDLQTKLILAEDVRQVLDYVVRGEVDAGIVYATDARIAGEKVRLAATADSDLHSPILYPIAVIKDSQQKPAAQEFVDLVLSAEGQNILQKYGFTDLAGK